MTNSIFPLGGFNSLVRGRDAFYLANENDAYVGQSLIKYDEYCEAEFRVLSRLVSPGNYIAEIGANVGAHTVRLAKLIGLDGRVTAFEPQPVLFQALAGTIALNSLMNVDCFPFALGKNKEQIMFPSIDYRRPNNFGGLSLLDLKEGGAKIYIEKFDTVYLHETLDFLKIDVEGMELEVLKGAKSSIQRHQPILYVENDNQEKSSSLIKWIFDAGYRLWWHLPSLFNPDNFFGNQDNIFKNLVSINMIGIPRNLAIDMPFPEIVKTDDFPLN